MSLGLNEANKIKILYVKVIALKQPVTFHSDFSWLALLRAILSILYAYALFLCENSTHAVKQSHNQQDATNRLKMIHWFHPDKRDLLVYET